MAEVDHGETAAIDSEYTYDVRRYRPEDRDGFLDLYDLVFGDDGRGGEWFDWKYVDNPYVEDVPIFLAVADGEVVGTRPFLAFRMRAGDETYLAFQTADTMVHPDHRRQGLFTRSTEVAFDHYGEREPAFTFNVPNDLSRPGFLDVGCEVVGALSTHYRVQEPAAFLGDGLGGGLGRVSKLLARGYAGLRDRTADVPPEVSVVRHVDVPAETLAALYRRRPPDTIHALRDETFFDYRFSNPAWEYTAYTARLGGRPVAGIVTGTRTVDGRTVTNLVDVVPLVGDEERDRGLPALLARVLEDHAASDVVAFRGNAIPGALLRSFGFHDDRSLPMSAVASPTLLIACPLPVDGDWRIGGRDLRDPETWGPTFAEQNTS